MKVRIRVIYRYGVYSLSHEKVIEMPDGIPNKDLIILEHDDQGELMVELREIDNVFASVKTLIMYEPKESGFYIENEIYWKRAVRPDVVDDFLSRFKQFNWKRIDSTDEESLKELMVRNSK